MLLEALCPAPAIPEIVGIAASVACAIGGDKLAFPEGLVPLPPMALISTALDPDVLLGAVTTSTLINKASSFASAPPTKYVSLVFQVGQRTELRVRSVVWSSKAFAR